MAEAKEIARNIRAQLDVAYSIERGARSIVKAYMGNDASAQMVDTTADELATLSSYQGWPNRETWCVNLWIGNEERHYDACRTNVLKALATGGEAWLNIAARRLSDYVELLITSHAKGGMAADMALCAFARVDWQCLAQSLAEV